MAANEPRVPTHWAVIGWIAGLLIMVAWGSFMMRFWSNWFHPSSHTTPVSRDIATMDIADDPWADARRQMIDEQFRARDIRNADVLAAMERVPRERFVPKRLQSQAYEDHPLPIGFGQTISQPYIVALMTQAARPTPRSRALEVGVGSGYQTAVLAELCKEVYGVEILPELAADAQKRLAELGYKNATVRCGDGYRGWPDYAPFDVILVTAAPDHVPAPLIEQLAPGGRLVVPVGRGFQELMLIEKKPDGSIVRESIAPVQFVPMTGEAER